MNRDIVISSIGESLGVVEGFLFLVGWIIIKSKVEPRTDDFSFHGLRGEDGVLRPDGFAIVV